MITKHNKYSNLNEPQAEFDYHGIDPFIGEKGIIDLTEKTIFEWANNGIQIGRLIIGKGNHSKKGPVIKPIVEKHLDTLKRFGHIKSFKYDSAHGTGPNTGALIIKI